MRITHSMITGRTVFELGRNLARMSGVRHQLTTGHRINSFPDDPRGVGILQRHGILLAANEQYLRNIGAARTFLDASDQALQEMADILSRLRETVVRESNATSTPQTRRAAEAEVRGMRDALLALANQKVQGAQLFGGHLNRTQPFLFDGTQVQYVGDDGVQEVQIGASLRLAATIPGSDLLGGNLAVLNGAADLLPRVTGATLLSDLRQGAGVAAGSVEITDGFGASAVVDLSTATTLQDVIDAINAAGLAVTARISDDESGITLDGTGPLAVAEVSGGATASDLGILGTDPGNSLVGTDVRPQLLLSTSLSEIPALSAGLPLGVLHFEIGGVGTDVDLSTATTLGDVRNAIASLVPGMDLQIVGGSLSIVSSNPQPFQVDSPSGDTTAVRLGLQGAGSPSRLFDVFGDVLQALQAGDVRALRQTLVEIDDVHGRLLDVDVDVGGRQELLDRAEAIVRNGQVSLQQQRSDLIDVDLVEVATKLTAAETAYQASLAAASRLFDLSLLDYL